MHEVKNEVRLFMIFNYKIDRFDLKGNLWPTLC